MKLSKSVKEYFDSDRQRTILKNVKEKYGNDIEDNREIIVEYGFSDAEVTLRAYKGWLIFVNTIGSS